MTNTFGYRSISSQSFVRFFFRKFDKPGVTYITYLLRTSTYATEYEMHIIFEKHMLTYFYPRLIAFCVGSISQTSILDTLIDADVKIINDNKNIKT